jgi:hypothetical protein
VITDEAHARHVGSTLHPRGAHHTRRIPTMLMSGFTGKPCLAEVREAGADEGSRQLPTGCESRDEPARVPHA